MHWQSYGYHYGIGIEIDLWLSKGCRVVVNGSRSYLQEAKDRYPNLKMIWIDATHAELKRRLEARGGETTEQIKGFFHCGMFCLGQEGMSEDKVTDRLPVSESQPITLQFD